MREVGNTQRTRLALSWSLMSVSLVFSFEKVLIRCWSSTTTIRQFPFKIPERAGIRTHPMLLPRHRLPRLAVATGCLLATLSDHRRIRSGPAGDLTKLIPCDNAA